MVDPDLTILRAFMHSLELRVLLDHTHGPSYTQPWELSLEDLRRVASNWGLALREICPDDKHVVFTNKRSRRLHPAFLAVAGGPFSPGWTAVEAVHYPHRTLELVEASRGLAGSSGSPRLRSEAEGAALRHIA